MPAPPRPSKPDSPQSALCARNCPRWGSPNPPRYEIDFRLKLKERDYEDAVLAAHGVTFDAVADDGLVIAGQPVKLSLIAVNRGASEVTRDQRHGRRLRFPRSLQAGRS